METTIACAAVIPCNGIFRSSKLIDASVLLIQRQGAMQWELPNGLTYSAWEDTAHTALKTAIENQFHLSVTLLFPLSVGGRLLCEDLESRPIHFVVWLARNERVQLPYLSMPEGVRAMCLLTTREVECFINAGVVFPAHVEPLRAFLERLKEGVEMTGCATGELAAAR